LLGSIVVIKVDAALLGIEGWRPRSSFDSGASPLVAEDFLRDSILWIENFGLVNANKSFLGLSLSAPLPGEIDLQLLTAGQVGRLLLWAASCLWVLGVEGGPVEAGIQGVGGDNGIRFDDGGWADIDKLFRCTWIILIVVEHHANFVSLSGELAPSRAKSGERNAADLDFTGGCAPDHNLDEDELDKVVSRVELVDLEKRSRLDGVVGDPHFFKCKFVVIEKVVA
jgi:hypothetical protein